MSELSAKNDLWAIIKAVTAPLAAYWLALKSYPKPIVVAAWIRFYERRPSDLVQYLLGSGVLVAIVVRLTGYRDATLELVDFPMVNELLEAGAVMLLGIATAAMYHKPFRWIGGIATFRETTVACAYAAALLAPWYVLAQGLYWRFTGEHINPMALFGFTAAYAEPLAAVHEVSLQKAVNVIVGSAAVLMAVAAVVAVVVVVYVLSS